MWNEFGFVEEKTGDGSPTLRMIQSQVENRPPESMHHSGGASAETEHIYGPIAKNIFEQISQPRFVCVGLGLGYIEMLVARESVHKNLSFMLSFESEEPLRRLFLDWVFSREIPLDCQKTYDLVAEYTLQNSEINIQDLKNILKSWFEERKWIIEGALVEDFLVQKKYGRFHGFFYDAFSSKTTAPLWTEEFLNKFLFYLADSDCALSTYACLGALKRALKNQNFNLLIRDGFLGKRNSTLAYRGVLKFENLS